MAHFTEVVGGSWATPTPDEYEPFDEQVAQMRLDGELDELDYSDLVFNGAE
jgi:hypothetical protein